MTIKYLSCAIACLWAFSVTNAQNDIPDEALEQWNELSLFEKMPYLMPQEDRDAKYHEYLQYGSTGGEDCFSFNALNDRLSEFQGEEQILEYWKYMDMNVDGAVCFDEYLYGRGEFEQNGNRYDFNEYEYLEKLMSEDIQRMQDQRVARIQEMQYELDENGIIID